MGRKPRASPSVVDNPAYYLVSTYLESIAGGIFVCWLNMFVSQSTDILLLHWMSSTPSPSKPQMPMPTNKPNAMLEWEPIPLPHGKTIIGY